MGRKGETTSFDGEARASIDIDGIKKGIEGLHFEISSNLTKLSMDKDDSSNMIMVAPSLLPEIICDILSRLPIEDIMRYKTVSKDWYALTKDPHFIDMHLRRALCLPRRLILEPAVHGPIRSLYLIDREDGRWRGREIPIENLQGDYLHTLCSCHGFLCVVTSSTYEVDPLFIYNPITRDSVELPKTTFLQENHFVSVGFGFDSTNKKYKIVRLFGFFEEDNPEPCMKGEIITLGDVSWRELDVSHPAICSSDTKPVFMDDALHWIIDRGRHPGILVLDLCTEIFRTIKFPLSLIRSIRYPDDVFLLNLGGSLSLVEHGYWEKLCVWRIARSSNKIGYKFYQSSYSMTVNFKILIWSISLKDKLLDGSFLFHVRHVNLSKELERKDHLVLHSPAQDEHRVLDISGIPKFFKPMLFVPCLISPSVAFGNTEQEEA